MDTAFIPKHYDVTPQQNVTAALPPTIFQLQI